MRVLNRAEIESLLTPAACLEAMRRVMIALAEGRTTQPLRTVVALHGGRDSALFMPAVIEEPPLLGAKLVTIYPDNHRHDVPSHHGGLLVFDAEHGRPIALLEGSSVTAIRTAAVTALATRLLARPDSRVLALLGTGVQAASHLPALLAVRSFEEVRVWSPRPASRRAFVSRAGTTEGVALRAVDSAEEAVRGADVVTAVTSSPQPIVDAGWISPGTHLNAVGASTATTRELDSATVAAASLFVDHLPAALEEAGELLVPVAEGRLREDHVEAELGEVAAGHHPGRTAGDEITVFKSVGLAVQDLAAAAAVLGEAAQRTVGTNVDW